MSLEDFGFTATITNNTSLSSTAKSSSTVVVLIQLLHCKRILSGWLLAVTDRAHWSITMLTALCCLLPSGVEVFGSWKDVAPHERSGPELEKLIIDAMADTNSSSSNSNISHSRSTVSAGASMSLTGFRTPEWGKLQRAHTSVSQQYFQQTFLAQLARQQGMPTCIPYQLPVVHHYHSQIIISYSYIGQDRLLEWYYVSFRMICLKIIPLLVPSATIFQHTNSSMHTYICMVLSIISHLIWAWIDPSLCWVIWWLT